MRARKLRSERTPVPVRVRAAAMQLNAMLTFACAGVRVALGRACLPVNTAGCSFTARRVVVTLVSDPAVRTCADVRIPLRGAAPMLPAVVVIDARGSLTGAPSPLAFARAVVPSLMPPGSVGRRTGGVAATGSPLAADALFA